MIRKSTANCTIIVIVFTCIAACLLGACKKKPKSGVYPVELDPATPEYNYASLKVFFGTDRNIVDPSSVKNRFGTGRGPLTLGFCNVSIPREHEMGELESPSIWRLEFREDPEKHVVLLDVRDTDRDTFVNQMKQSLQMQDDKRALIYVHGYNVTFADAAKRTAQMAYDLGYGGLPMFFSWPSQGSTAAYTIDEANNEWCINHLVEYFKEVLLHSSATRIDVIAHSMGARATVRALAALATECPVATNIFHDLLLAAPDIDAGVFKDQVLPSLSSYSKAVTMYTSASDLALSASRSVHGSARAGDASRGIVIAPMLETIDATDVDTSFVGHSYYGDERTLLADIYALLLQGQRPDQRFGLKQRINEQGKYWQFKE